MAKSRAGRRMQRHEKRQVAKATRAYRVYFSKAGSNEKEADDDYLVDHSIVLYLVGRDGEFLEFFTQSTTAEECVARASPYLDEV